MRRRIVSTTASCYSRAPTLSRWSFWIHSRLIDRHHADEQIDVARDVHLGRHHRAVQPFVEQQVGARGHVLPGGESAGLLSVRRAPRRRRAGSCALAGAGLAVGAEERLELREQVGPGPKWLKCLSPDALLGDAARASRCDRSDGSVALDERRARALAPKICKKVDLDGRRARRRKSP